ncbi:lysis system i-spanin subunit Rz [Undibacterium sp. Ji42W]|uniref:lysis system i-spanin subunit Rz n=1 Tax=Undibacterium sp. Ji42W TaxID=3413039 RepID=UPI003BF4221D
MLNIIKALDPRPWIALAVAAAVLFCVVKYKDAIHQVDKLTAQIEKDKAEATATARENEKLMSRSLAAIATTHQKEMQDEKDKRDKFIDDVRTGAVRLSIPVKACSARTGTNTAAGFSNSDQARAQLTPEAGAALAAIAADGDDAIRQLNACIDSYQAIRAITNHVQTK